MEVASFKLTSGEEIITRVAERNEEEGYIVVDRPNMVGIAQAPNGAGLAVQLMPWFASDQEGSAKVFINHIVAEIKPNEELEKGYLQRTSGIAMALG